MARGCVGSKEVETTVELDSRGPEEAILRCSEAGHVCSQMCTSNAGPQQRHSGNAGVQLGLSMGRVCKLCQAEG